MKSWTPELNPRILRRVGKLLEEISELSKVCSRIIIQGIDGEDPDSKECNKLSLAKESADVLVQISLLVDSLNLDTSLIETRKKEKLLLMKQLDVEYRVEEEACQLAFRTIRKFEAETNASHTDTEILDQYKKFRKMF